MLSPTDSPSSESGVTIVLCRNDPKEMEVSFHDALVDEEGSKLESHDRNGSIWGSVFSLSNSAIGAGVLALPLAVSKCGLVLGIMLLIAFGCLAGLTLRLLVFANRLVTQAKSYEQVVFHLFGAQVARAVSVCASVNLFGAGVGFLIIMADLMCMLVELVAPNYPQLNNRIAITIFFSVFGIYPLCIMKNYHALRYPSLFAVASVSFVLTIIMIRGIGHLVEHGSQGMRLFKFELSTFSALPLMLFAFGAHFQINPIFGELRDHKRQKPMDIIVGWHTTNCVLLYCATASFGYLTFGDELKANILTNYPMNDTLANVGRSILAFAMIAHFPPAMLSCRTAVDHLIFGINQKQSLKRVEIAVLLALEIVLALIIPNIQVVFGLAGATVGCFLKIVMPAVYVLKFHRNPRWIGPTGWGAYLASAFLLLLGLVISVMGTWNIVKAWI